MVINGHLLGAVASKCLSKRLALTPAFPENVIRRLLSHAGLQLRDLPHVAIAHDTFANPAVSMAYFAKHPIKAGGAGVDISNGASD